MSLVGTAAGVALSAVFVSAGVLQLDGVALGALHYGAAIGMAFALAALERRRHGARGATVSIVLAVLLTFAVRRWLTVWVNLEPFEWRSGPLGLAAPVIFPLEGAVLGAVLGAPPAAQAAG
jgi:membrane-bound metal-dependent hydrolase YbcI (DUF457 family)